MVTIGLTGPMCSGKGEVAGILQTKGFEFTSLSDRIREKALEKGVELNRENLQNLGNELRKTMGNDILARLTLEKIDMNKSYIIDSIRNIEELRLLKTYRNFHLLSLDSSPNIRFQRAKEKSKSYLGIIEKEAETDEDLIKSLAIDSGLNQDNSGQNVRECMTLADFTIQNDGSLDELKSNVEELLEKLEIKKRPSWDKYFLGIANSVKERSSCLTRQQGAILVKDKRIISTGYNGTPKSLKHCDQGGCERCTLRVQGKINPGDALERCICSHAEENAVVQAAYHGISSKGATLYTTNVTCVLCARIIINSGISKVVTSEIYPDSLWVRVFKDAGVELVYLKNE